MTISRGEINEVIPKRKTTWITGEHGILGHSYPQDSGGRCLTEVEAEADPQGYSTRCYVWQGAWVSMSCDSMLHKCDLDFTEI